MGYSGLGGFFVGYVATFVFPDALLGQLDKLESEFSDALRAEEAEARGILGGIGASIPSTHVSAASDDADEIEEAQLALGAIAQVGAMICARALFIPSPLSTSGLPPLPMQDLPRARLELRHAGAETARALATVLALQCEEPFSGLFSPQVRQPS